MRTLCIALLLLISGSAMAADNTAVWKQAVAMYQQKQYDSAAVYFEQLAAAQPDAPALYYNLGNTYYRLNRMAPAILNYERTLRLDPGNKQAKDNLALAQNRVPNHIAEGEEIFFIEWWRGLTRPTKATGWAVASVIVFLLVIGIAIYRRYNSRGRAIPIQVPGVGVFICFCLMVLALISANKSYSRNRAVVMETDIPLMPAAQKGKPLVMIPEGTTVKITDTKDNWVEVTLPDGRSGWVQQVYITVI